MWQVWQVAEGHHLHAYFLLVAVVSSRVAVSRCLVVEGHHLHADVPEANTRVVVGRVDARTLVSRPESKSVSQ